MTLFCEYLRYLRKTHHLSQKNLSQKLHVSTATIGRWERNLSFPPVEKLLDIAAIFNVSLDKLVRLAPESVLDLYGLTEQQKKLLIRLSRILDPACIRDNSITKTAILDDAFHLYQRQ